MNVSRFVSSSEYSRVQPGVGLRSALFSDVIREWCDCFGFVILGHYDIIPFINLWCTKFWRRHGGLISYSVCNFYFIITILLVLAESQLDISWAAILIIKVGKQIWRDSHFESERFKLCIVDVQHVQHLPLS